MPALPSPGKIIRVDFFQTLGADATARDRLFFSYSGTVSSTDLTTLLTTMRNAWSTNISPLQVNVNTLTSLLGTDLSSNTGAQVLLAASATGTAAAQGQGAGIAGVVRFKIARRYRGGHPRFYLGGLPATDLVTSQQWAPGTISSVQSAFAAFIAACILTPPAGIGTVAHVNVSFFQGFTVSAPVGKRAKNVATPRATPLVDPVIAYTLNPHVGSQRRRNLQTT